jgi:hypothetical protein
VYPKQRPQLGGFTNTCQWLSRAEADLKNGALTKKLLRKGLRRKGVRDSVAGISAIRAQATFAVVN